MTGPSGPDSSGLDPSGPDSSGLDPSGPVSSGSDSIGPDSSLPDPSGPDSSASGLGEPGSLDLGPVEPEPAPARPSTFSLEGRAVPGLYVVGWVASIMGLGILLVSFMAAGSRAAAWLFLAGLVVLAIGVLAAAGSQTVERLRRHDLAYRGPSPVLAFAVVVPVTLILIIAVLAPLSALGLDPGSPLATTLSLALTVAVYVAVIRLLVVGPGALSWREMGLGQSARAAARDLAIGAVCAVPVLGVTLVLGGLLTRFLEPSPSPLPAPGGGFGLMANLVSAAVLAPLGEELFFRGFATTAWAKAVGFGPAVVRGAAFFAIAHVVTLFDDSAPIGAQRALFSFLALLPVGLALGWLFLSRRSLYASIGLHAAFNAVQVVALFVVGSAA